MLKFACFFSLAFGYVTSSAGLLAQQGNQSASAQPAAASIDPSELFYYAWSNIQQAEAFNAKQNYAAAIDRYKKAQSSLQQLSEMVPDWKPNMVANRRQSTAEALQNCQKLASQQALERPRGDGIETIPPSSLQDPTRGSQGSAPPSLKSTRELELERQLSEAQDQLKNQQLNRQQQNLLQQQNRQQQQQLQQQLQQQQLEATRQLEKQIKELRQELSLTQSQREAADKKVQALELQIKKQQAPQPNPELQPGLENNVRELMGQLQQAKNELAEARRQNKLLESRLSLMTLDLVKAQNERDIAKQQLALNHPLKGQLEELNKGLLRSKLELEAMSTALFNTQKQLQQATEARQLGEQRQNRDAKELATLKAQLQQDRNLNDKLINSLNQRIAQLEEQGKKDKLKMSSDQGQIALLQQRLAEAQLQIGDLGSQRDTLLKEKEQLTSLLNLNNAEQIQKSIVENARIMAKLKEAEDRLTTLLQANAASQNELKEAKTEVALLKQNAIEMRDENVAFRKRVSELGEQLRDTKQQLDLAAQKPDLDPKIKQENGVLRELVSRQLRALASREKARELLIASYKRLGLADEQMRDAIKALADNTLSLSEEEKQLVATNNTQNAKANSILVAPGYSNEAVRQQAIQKLEFTVTSLSEGAQSAYDKGRFAAAEQLYQTILEKYPQHFSTLVNLGVVQLKLKQPLQAAASFRDAIDMNAEHPLAHFLLGVALYQDGEDLAAKKALLQAIKLDPAHAKAFVYLGNIAWSANEHNEAVKHFEQALKIEPKLLDARLNLVNLLISINKLEQAKSHYDQAVMDGYTPNAALEGKLKAKKAHKN